MEVMESKKSRVGSVCMRSLASACHSAWRYNNIITISLWWEGNRPSNAGIAHCRRYDSELDGTVCKLSILEIHTCNKSSKFRAAIFFISDALFENRRMVPRPKVGTSLNLITNSSTFHN